MRTRDTTASPDWFTPVFQLPFIPHLSDHMRHWSRRNHRWWRGRSVPGYLGQTGGNKECVDDVPLQVLTVIHSLYA